MKWITPLVVAFALLLFTGCNVATVAVGDAQVARGEYFAAANTYKKVYNKTKARDRKQRGEIAFKMGLAYEKINMCSRTTNAFLNAQRYFHTDSLLPLKLAQAQQKEGKYKDALKSYQIYRTKCPEDILAINGEIGCHDALRWKKMPTRYVVKKNTLFSSNRSEFSPVYYGKDKDMLYFNSSNEKALGTSKSEITGLKNNAIFFTKKNEKGVWMRPELLEGEPNSEHDDGTICFSPDGNTLYLSRARQEPTSNTTVEIYTSQRTGASWSAPTKFKITGDTLSAFAHPAVSPDGLYLYFTSNMVGGQGGTDLWRISLNDKGESGVENLGAQINTPGDEMFPVWRNDGVLFFSSTGHPGMGGLDLFMATPDSIGNGWKIENLQAPINSQADDFGITFETPIKGLLSSNRGDARGYDHLYSFELPNIVVQIEGKVYDRDEEPLADSKVRIVGNDGTHQLIVTRKDGSYKAPLNLGTRYVMLANSRGYLNNKQQLVTSGEEKNATYKIDFILSSMTKSVPVENVFYEFNSAQLSPESKAALDELFKMLQDNPNISIELGAHTDMIGSEGYNQVLSARRAQSVVDYLVSAGVDPDRLVAKGYGESTPKLVTHKISQRYPFLYEDTLLDEFFIATLPAEEQEIANSVNRRTEFKVLNTDFKLR